MQITKDVIKEYDELVECFKYLNINMLNDSKFVFDSPEPFIKNITGISEQEWSLINNLDIFINCFPIEEKKVNETWKEFLIKTKENAEVSLMKLVNDRKADVCGAGWELISDYLTESANQSKCKNKLQNMKFGIGPKPYKLKWWKTWN
jgi:hypothetical protein